MHTIKITLQTKDFRIIEVSIEGQSDNGILVYPNVVMVQDTRTITSEPRCFIRKENYPGSKAVIYIETACCFLNNRLDVEKVNESNYL